MKGKVNKQKKKQKQKSRLVKKNSCRLDVCLANLVYLFHPKLSQFFFYNKDVLNFFFLGGESARGANQVAYFSIALIEISRK